MTPTKSVLSVLALGAFLFRNARYQDAISVYRTLASHVSADASSYNGLAISYYMNGDFASAAVASLSSLGVIEIPRNEYLARLAVATEGFDSIADPDRV